VTGDNGDWNVWLERKQAVKVFASGATIQSSTEEGGRDE